MNKKFKNFSSRYNVLKQKSSNVMMTPVIIEIEGLISQLIMDVEEEVYEMLEMSRYYSRKDPPDLKKSDEIDIESVNLGELQAKLYVLSESIKNRLTDIAKS